MPSRDDDIETMPEGDLLTIPSGNVPSGLLTMVSSDDDMRPYSLVEHSPESLGVDEVSRGRLHRSDQNGYAQKSFDIISAFLDVLGKPAHQVPDNYERGEFLMDTSMDLETNATTGLARENSLMLHRSTVPDDAMVKMVQTFRSGTNDFDAVDFVECFWRTKTRPA